MFRGNISLLRLSFGAFIVAFHFYLIAYVNSALIATRIGEGAISPLYMTEASLVIILFLFAARILRRIGARWFLAIFIFLEGISLLTIAAVTSPLVTGIAFVVAMTSTYMIWFAMDIFIEHATLCEGVTGKVRGTLLTFGNSALIVAPLVMALVLHSTSYETVYLLSAGLLFMFAAFILPLYGTFRDPEYIPATLASLKHALIRHRDLLPTVGAQFMLSLFYSFAVIYMPLYLLDLGFSWTEVSIILTIALLPFVLVEFPLGRMADKSIGEKEIMIAGFAIVIASTVFLSLPFAPSLVLYALLFLTTRLGAAMVEITAETHFFREVEAKDGIVITLSRMMGAFGYLVGAGVGGLALSFVSLHEAFFFFGIVLLPGLYFASRIKDSR